MNTKLWICILILAASLPGLPAQDCADCVPVATVHNTELYNPCGDATAADYCVDIIRKTTQHTILWPDGALETAWLTARGRSACAASCMKDWIGAPWTHRACWPEFYTPVASARNYYAAAADNRTGVLMQWCATMSYVAAVYCLGPTGPLRYINIDHLCSNCRSNEDMDQDGYISIESGGDDCNDLYPYINPGAAPICYPGYDANCDGTPDFLEPACVNSPVLINLGKQEMALTSNEAGVRFDLDSDGTAEQLSWTVANTEDAWLCLDRNRNGSIDNGEELFGSYTPQPDPPPGTEANGFLALAVFDTAEKGGNGNGVIDRGDPVYRDLLLWRDVNHNGISEPGELSSLRSSGILEIDLDYRLSRKADQYGNQFRYRARLKTWGNAHVGKWAWDVFLVRK